MLNHTSVSTPIFHRHGDHQSSSEVNKVGSSSEVVCLKCSKQRTERKEIITEIVETELKYGRDLRIIVEEFYRPMLVAGLLTSDLLAAIFLNVDELIQVNAKFGETLKDAVEIAVEHGDEDLAGVNVGKLFMEAMGMLRAYESYCTRQVRSLYSSFVWD